ncbi:MAG: outer membrane protein assembly factor BamA [Alphaproteobacteria bacterium]|nr:outer membrane protein assembly factor BamA [Alphaproteobacteria bacterium]
MSNYSVFKNGGLCALRAVPALVCLSAVLSSPAYAQKFGGMFSAPAPQAVSSEAVIQDISIEGVQRLEVETISSYLTIAKGSGVNSEKLDASLKALYATGLFSDVKLRVEGATLIVSVVENPVINKVTFEGTSHISTEDLEKEVQLKPRLVYTLPRVQKDVQRILDVYRRSGRFGALVEPKLVKLEQNRVNLIFEITEGESTGVRRIKFIGNVNYSDEELGTEINTRESAWWRFMSSSDFYDPDRTNYDRELLRRFYLNQGYIDFRVLSAVAELTPDRKDFFLTFTVDEGPRYKFGKVNIKSDIKGLDASTLQPLLTTKEGDWYSSGATEKTVALLTAALGDRQYAFAEITPDIDRHKESLTVDLTYRVKQGQRVYIDRIDVGGNLRTVDKVIRREMVVADGDPFSTSKIKKSEQKLKDLGFFQEVAISTNDGAQPDRANLKVDVKEKSTGEISFGAGFSSTDGPLGDFRVRERNFMGRGQDASLGATISGSTKQFDFSFTEPYFMDRDLAVGFDVFHTRTDNQSYSSYDQRNTGFTLRAGFPLSEVLRERFTYTLQRTEITDVPTTASRFIRDQMGETMSSVIGHELAYDVRDSKLDPTKGFITKLNTDVAGLGGDRKYFRLKLGGTQYFELADDYILSILGEGGYLWGLGDSKIRISERFFLGGDTLRGFQYAGMGPRDLTNEQNDAIGGNRFSRGSVELTVPTFLPKEMGIKAHMFVDAGTLGKIDETPKAGEIFMNEENLRASGGVGATWQSPFGPLRLDVARPFMKESYDKTEFFHFSFGTRF